MELNGRIGLWNTCGLKKTTVFPFLFTTSPRQSSMLLQDAMQPFSGAARPDSGGAYPMGAIGVTLSTLSTASTRGWWEMYEIGGNSVLPKSA
jgi:hypothetical protein